MQSYYTCAIPDYNFAAATLINKSKFIQMRELKLDRTRVSNNNIVIFRKHVIFWFPCAPVVIIDFRYIIITLNSRLFMSRRTIKPIKTIAIFFYIWNSTAKKKIIIRKISPTGPLIGSAGEIYRFKKWSPPPCNFHVERIEAKLETVVLEENRWRCINNTDKWLKISLPQMGFPWDFSSFIKMKIYSNS